MAIDPDVQELIDRINERLDALEKIAHAPAVVHPVTVTEDYEDGSQLVYKVQP